MHMARVQGFITFVTGAQICLSFLSQHYSVARTTAIGALSILGVASALDSVSGWQSLAGHPQRVMGVIAMEVEKGQDQQGGAKDVTQEGS